MDVIYARGDRWIRYFVLGHFTLALVLAAAAGRWLASVIGAVASAALFLGSERWKPRSQTIRFAAGISLQAFCALHTYQLGGLPEMHFFFSAVTMMIVYQDWSAMWPGVILIVMQHIVFAVLQNGGYGIHYFGEARATERAAALTRQLLASGRRQLLHGSVLWVTPRDATRRAASRVPIELG
jgi:hypothetical protein